MSIRQQLSYARAFMGIMHGSRAFGGPAQVNLNLTNRCNIRCVHCYFYSPFIEKPNLVSVRKARESGEASPGVEELRRLQNIDIDHTRVTILLHDLLKMGTRRFQLSARGEPFLYTHLMEHIACLKHAGSYCVITTNGTLIDTTTADDLIRLGVDELRITVMAGTNEVYMRTHPGISATVFPTLKNTLRHISEQKKRRALRRPRIVLAIIVTAQNADNIAEFGEFAAEVGADGVLFRPVDDIGDQGLAKAVPSREQALSLRRQLVEARDYLESRRISHNIHNFLKVCDTQLDTRALYQHIPCYYGWLSVNVNPEGEVFACCRCYTLLGNIYETAFSQIWNGVRYRNLRRQALQLPKRKMAVSGCDCYSCVHHTANLKAYKMVHPFRGRSDMINRLTP